ncbi:MAG TPA: tetratricopeptide repeat protein [Nodosilinea sp.]|nr:tetratricopeptide repeat protein [Nodosilinea sp.]
MTTSKSSIGDLLKAGIEQARLGYFEAAVGQFSQAIALDATCAKAFYNRGCAHRDLSRYGEAIADFSAALRLNPAFANAYINRGSVYRLIGQLGAALDDLDQALAVQPDAVKAYGNRGRIKLDLEDYGGAIADFSAVLAEQPNFTKVLLWRGLAYLKQGAHAALAENRREAYQLAIDDFSRLLHSQPHHAEALNYRAVAYFQLRNMYEATLDINRALACRADYAEAYINRGMLRHELGDFQGAIDDYTAVLELNPDLQDRSYNQTLVGLALDSPDATLSEDAPLNLRFRLADLYDSRGLLRAQVGDGEGAVADYTLALRFNPRSGRILANRGRVFSRQGDYPAAIADFDSALAINDGDALAYCDRGYALYFLDEWAMALEDFNQALVLNPNLAEAYIGRGHTNIRLGNGATLAMNDFRKALELSWDSRKSERSRLL